MYLTIHIGTVVSFSVTYSKTESNFNLKNGKEKAEGIEFFRAPFQRKRFIINW